MIPFSRHQLNSGDIRSVVKVLRSDFLTTGKQVPIFEKKLTKITKAKFAFACNSYNQAAVAQNNMITFIAPAQKGDKLLAKAREVSRSGRSGIYDVSVLSQDQKKIAEFRGHSRTIGGQNFEE